CIDPIAHTSVWRPGLQEEASMTRMKPGMNDGAATRTSRLIKAAPETIFQALTDPAALAVWRAPSDMTGEVHRFVYGVGGGYEMSLYYPASEASMRGKTQDKEDRFTA